MGTPDIHGTYGLFSYYAQDTSAFDGKRIEQLDRKGMVNNKFNAFIMQKLEAAGVPTQFDKLLGDNECLVKKLDMIPVECVVRNYAAGSLVKRLGVEEGMKLNPYTFELFLNAQGVEDPLAHRVGGLSCSLGRRVDAHPADVVDAAHDVVAGGQGRTEVAHRVDPAVGRQGLGLEADEDLEPLAGELSNIIGWVEQLAEVDTEGVKPTSHAITLTNAFREDEQQEHLDREQVLERMRPLLEDPERPKIGQNLKYDIKVLHKYQLSVQGPLFDTMLAHYLLQPELRHNMDYLAETYLQQSMLLNVDGGLLDLTAELNYDPTAGLTSVGEIQLTELQASDIETKQPLMSCERIEIDRFELYLDYGMRIKARSPAVQTFVVQLAGQASYLPTARSVAGGAYGAVPESTEVGPEGGRELVDQTVKLISSLWNEPEKNSGTP